MEKIKLLLLGLLVAFCAKILSTGSSVSDAAIVVAILASTLFYEIAPKNNKIKELDQKLADLVKDQERKAKELDDLRTRMASVQISSGLRNIKN